MENTTNKTIFMYGWNKSKPEKFLSLKVRTVSEETCKAIWTTEFGNNVFGNRMCAYVVPGDELDLT